MPLPARNTLAIIGAGPVGLEAALRAIDAGFDVHVFEQGEIGSHPLGWGHVQMFTPWRMNVGPVSRTHLERAGWTMPEPDGRPTGREFAERYLAPLAKTPAFEKRIHPFSQVVQVSRRGALRTDKLNNPLRRERPFRLLVRDQGGRESFLHAFAVIDASGVYHKPNWAGDGGIPARNEISLAPQIFYHLPDVAGVHRGRFAGRRTIVIGGGTSAATTVVAIATLAAEAPGTGVVWATRGSRHSLQPTAMDSLAARRKLFEQAHTMADGGSDAVSHVGGAMVEGMEFNSATHRYRVTLRIGEEAQVEEVDEIVVHTGYGPDETLTRELQLDAAFATLDSPKLEHTEPDFFVIGNKSYGRAESFLLEAGYWQAEQVITLLAPRTFTAAPEA